MKLARRSLSFALDELGILHEADEHTANDGKRSWFGRTGILLGRFDAFDGWKKIKELKAEGR